MSEERKRILKMLAEGKLSADEAESLLDAANGSPALSANGDRSAAKNPKYLRVLVEGGTGNTEESGQTVNVRVPISLIRAGMRLAALLPASA